jgi:hypothetical protein
MPSCDSREAARREAGCCAALGVAGNEENMRNARIRVSFPIGL